MGIGLNVRDRRIELGLTQEELAARMGYKSKSTINKIELGINDIPLSKVKEFAEALSTTESRLMGWEDASSQSTADQVDSLFIDKYGRQVFDAAMTFASLDEVDRGRVFERMSMLLEDDKYKKGLSGEKAI